MPDRNTQNENQNSEARLTQTKTQFAIATQPNTNPEALEEVKVHPVVPEKLNVKIVQGKHANTSTA